jgi:hypothetical protein
LEDVSFDLQEERGTLRFLRDIIQCSFAQFNSVFTVWYNILHVCSSFLMFNFIPVTTYALTVRWDYLSDNCTNFREFCTERQERTCSLIRNIPHKISPSINLSYETEEEKSFCTSSSEIKFKVF